MVRKGTCAARVFPQCTDSARPSPFPLHAGDNVCAPPNPLRGVAQDAETLSGFLATISGPVVLVERVRRGGRGDYHARQPTGYGDCLSAPVR
ncbi:hypothetical protein ACE1SV_70750 [Streptomyces sennicomposti]